MPKIIENIKEQILEEGKHVLVNKNYKELNIRDIAKSCNIGIGTFYNYFKNKEELVNEIFMGDWIKLVKNFDKVKYSNLTFKDKLRLLYIDLDVFINNYMSIFYEIAMATGSEDHDMSHTDLIYKVLDEVIEFERNNGTFTNALPNKTISRFIYNNLVMLSKNKYMTFDELFDSLRL